MALQTEQLPEGICLITMPPFLDVSNHAAIREEILDVLTEGQHVLLDLGETDFIDSSGIAVLLAIYRQAKENSASLTLCCPNTRVLTSLHLVRMENMVGIYSSRDEAVKAISA
jgi:anti-sigma B factor antagonist